MMNSVDYVNLGGGIDSRLNFDEEKELPNLTFWQDACNVEIFNGLLQKMNGCKSILDLPS